MEPTSENKQENEIKLDRKSKILFVFFAVLIIGAVSATYYRYMVKRDYIVKAQIDCDPEIESCFIWKCDPSSLVEGEKCTGVPDNDIWYYENLYRNAKSIPACDPKDENCTAYICGEGEKDCNYELCSSENVPDGEECNNPEQYLIDNPPEEDISCDPETEDCLDVSGNEQCAPDDQECLNAATEDASAECDPDTEDCTSVPSNEECAPDDQECIIATVQDNSANCDPSAQDCENVSSSQDNTVVPDSSNQNSDSVPDNPDSVTPLP
jgi:hypothetical protein